MPHDLREQLTAGYLVYLSHGFVPVFRVLFSPPRFLAPSIKIRLFSTANYQYQVIAQSILCFLELAIVLFERFRRQVKNVLGGQTSPMQIQVN